MCHYKIKVMNDLNGNIELGLRTIKYLNKISRLFLFEKKIF